MPSVDPARIAIIDRWLAAVALISEAESAAQADVGSSNVVAVATAQSAAEIALGLIAGEDDATPRRNETFDQLLERAKVAVLSSGASIRLPRRFQADLLNLNEARNAALHRGVPVAHSQAVGAPDVARGVVDILPRLYEETKVLPPGSGLPSAIASLLDSGAIADPLRDAEAKLSEGDTTGSADHAALALDRALRRAQAPRLISSGRIHFRSQFNPRDPQREITDRIKAAEDQIDLTDRWILEVATGLDPRSLGRLREVLGRPMNTSGGLRSFRSVSPTTDDARWALARVAEVVYRLWTAGRLELNWRERERAKAEALQEAAIAAGAVDDPDSATDEPG